MRFKLTPKLLLSSFCLTSLLLLSACGPTGLILGAGATAGSMALEERGFQQSVKDKETTVSILQRLGNAIEYSFVNVSVNVIENKVYLTGAVKNREQRLAATEVAWQLDAVEEVRNEIQITKDGGILNTSRDLLTKTNLISDMTFDQEIHAVNYHISVVNGVVYLMGIAQNKTEIERAIARAKSLSYVRKVVSLMILKNDPARLDWLKENQETEEKT